ncbi:MAG: hypothetical protein ACREDU_13205, partial [Methylocella sp.]
AGTGERGVERSDEASEQADGIKGGAGWQSSWVLAMDKIAGSDFEQPKAGSAGVNPRDGVNSFLPGGHSRTNDNWGLVRA